MKRLIGMVALLAASALFTGASYPSGTGTARKQIGREVAIEQHLQDDEEFKINISDLIAYGKKLFSANWTEQDGGGRPLTKGNGRELSDPKEPLIGTRSFNQFPALIRILVRVAIIHLSVYLVGVVTSSLMYSSLVRGLILRPWIQRM
ncbi:MAG: hypothetical protein IPP36_06930 [Nitrosomonadales bacterium]|nr:hypothetical protein [Nitrosomonadales bacterium]